ncbi:TolC family protein [Candidatus Poribacteria bacterium]
MKTQRIAILLPAVCLLLALILSACGRVSHTPYHQALEQAATPPEPEYYRAEVSRSVETWVETETSTGWTEELERLFQMKEEQQVSAPEPFYDFSSPQSVEYRRLVTDSEKMIARLAEPVNLDLLLSLAFERNQGLQAAYRKIEATLEQYPQAAYLDNILLQYNAFTKQLDTKIGKPRHKEMVAMKFPFPDMLSIKGNIVTQDVQLLQKDAEVVLRDLITDVRLAYYDYLFVDESLSITRENQELIRQIIQIATAKFRAGTANYQSILKAQVALSRLSDSILTLEEKRQMLVAKINTLLSRPPDAPMGPAESLEYLDVTLPLDELYALATEHRQEIQKQKIAISKMELMIEMAGKMSTPDASTGNSYFEDRTRIRSGTDMMPMTFMTKRTVNPRTSAWFAKDDAYTREVEVKVEAMEQMIVNMEDKTRFMVKMHHFGADTAKRSIALYENTLILQAQQALEAAFAAYQAAKVDFLNLLDAQSTLLNFQLAKQKALLNHRQHTAQLEQAVGVALPKQALDLDDVTTIDTN